MNVVEPQADVLALTDWLGLIEPLCVLLTLPVTDEVMLEEYEAKGLNEGEPVEVVLTERETMLVVV